MDKQFTNVNSSYISEALLRKGGMDIMSGHCEAIDQTCTSKSASLFFVYFYFIPEGVVLSVSEHEVK